MVCSWFGNLKGVAGEVGVTGEKGAELGVLKVVKGAEKEVGVAAKLGGRGC